MTEIQQIDHIKVGKMKSIYAHGHINRKGTSVKSLF